MKKIFILFFFTVFSSAQIQDSISKNTEKDIDEVVVTGTLKPVSRIETPVPVEIYTATFLKKNPT